MEICKTSIIALMASAVAILGIFLWMKHENDKVKESIIQDNVRFEKIMERSKRK